jgi:hypothetical protein
MLQRRFAELLGWERRKRWEQVLIALCCYAWFAALVTLPLTGLLPPSISPWWMPLVFLPALAPLVIFKSGWRAQDATRALARLDKTLGLEERAITAWELLARGDQRAAALLVLKEAEARLKTLEPRALFARRWSWQAYLAPPLFLLWFSLLWFEAGAPAGRNLRLPAAQNLAHKLREFSRELQEKAKSEGLRESLQLGRELEKTAQKGIDAKTADEEFKRELAGVGQKIEGMGKSGAEQPSFSTAESQQSLRDLKAELEAAKELLHFPDGAKGSRELGQQWLDRLSGLPQLQKQLDQQGRGGQGLSQDQLRSFLDKLDGQVTGELDRRTLLDAQQFLEQLMKQGQGENEVRVAGRGEQDAQGDEEKTRNRSSQPGSEPGKKADAHQPPPQFPAGAATQLKGLLGDGGSSGVVLKGKPLPGKSGLSQDEIVASYRRQAEQELNSERVPEALKETIRNYFLSLGAGEGRK